MDWTGGNGNAYAFPVLKMVYVHDVPESSRAVGSLN